MKNETKLMFLLLAGTGLALGLLTSPYPRFSDPSAVTEPNQPAAEPVSGLSPSVRAKAQMLSNLEHQVAWYMSKHDDHQPGVVSSKRALLFQLPSGGSNTSPNIGDPNQPGNLFPAADPPAPQRVILKLKQAPSSRISAQPQSRSLASQAQPVPSQAEGPVPSDVEGPDPFDQIRQHFPAAAIKKVFPDKPSAPPGPSGPRQLQSAQKAPVSHGFDRLYGVQVELPPGQTLDEFVDFCNRIETVEYAEIDYPLTAHAVPNDPDFPLQWHLDNIGQDYPASGSYNPPPGLVDADIDAPEAWETVTDCNEVIIAVIDTGVDYDHPDLVNNMWVNSAELNGEPEVDDDDNGVVDDIHGFNVIDASGDPKDDNGHGTHCAGIIAAEGNNAADISGVCWSANIMALKFLNRNGSGSTLDSVQAIVYAVDNGAHIISNSYGGPGNSQAVQEAIDYAVANGVVFVASAGNDGVDVPLYPAAYEQVLSVAATDSTDQRVAFSSYGDWVDLAAPGVDILSLRAEGTALGTVVNDTTTILSGTSMACPVVAGTCALVLSANQTLTSDQIQPLLLSTLDPIEGLGLANDGRLNAHGAVNALYGQVHFGQARYACSSQVDLWLSDLDLFGQGIADVTVQTENGDIEQVLLVETAPVMGFFTGSISAGTGPADPDDGILQFSDGQTITVSYFNASDINGQPQTLTDTAVTDCSGPVLSGLDIQAPGSVITIRFVTDEPARVSLNYATSCEDLSLSEIHTEDLLTEHTVTLRNLLPESTYYVTLQTEDALGNVSVHDNDGTCFSFTTSTVLGDLYVPQDFSTIQTAVDRAWDRDTLWLADGIYTGEGNHDIHFDGKQLTVQSINGPANCIVDCDSAGRGFILNNDPNVIIDGLTIKRGYTKTNVNDHIREYLEGGGGIYAFHSNAVIQNCIFEDNFVRGYGGAVYADGGTLKIRDCTFTDNTAEAAGGACSFEGIFQDAQVTMDNCSVSGNISSLYGGGIDFRNASVTITHSDIRNNTLYNDVILSRGGGVYAGFKSNLNLQDTQVANNTAELGGGLSTVLSRSFDITSAAVEGNQADQGGGVYISDCNAMVTNCLITENTADHAGGIMQWANVSAEFQNCTITQNTAAQSGSGISSFYDVNSNLVNSILWDNTPQTEQIYLFNDANSPNAMAVSFCDLRVEAVFDPNAFLSWGPGNISADPLFAFPADAHLIGASPCIDQGTDQVPYPKDTDLDGSPRRSDGNADGTAQVDIGAYEFDPSGPVIALSASSLQFEGTAGQSTGPAENIQIRNPGGGSLTWQVQPTADWVQVTPSQGSTDDQVTDLQVQINTADLAGGDYAAELSVTAPQALNSPRTIRIGVSLRGTIHVPARYPTIQAAIDVARDGDTVLVADGIYRGQGNRNLKLNGKAIHLKSENGPDHCIIDVEGSEDDPHRAFTCHYTQETNHTLIQGFTLTGGLSGPDYFKIFPPFDGGAIWCGASRPVFKDCIIENNIAFSAGGGGYFIALLDEWAEFTRIENCILSGNQARGNSGVFSGGGAVWIQDQVNISNSLVAQNHSRGNGGAVSLFGLNQTITNTTVTENEAENRGGGIYVWDAYQDLTQQLPDFEINNSILNGNSAVTGNQLSCDYVGQIGPPRIMASHSNIPNDDNDMDLHPDTVWVGDGRLDYADPQFADPEIGDYRLLPASPLIDRGSNDRVEFASVDLDNNPRFIDADYDGLPQVDLGPYEFIPTPYDQPLIEISDWQFDFIAYQGEGNPPPQGFGLRNSGTGSFQWQTPASCPWLVVSPQSGENSGVFIEVALQPDITGLGRGRYACELAVESPTAANSPRTFTVNLQVFERGKIFVPSEFATLQQAINFAGDGDHIIIAPGTYNENIYLAGKNITLRSQDPNDWDVVKTTVISGSGSNPVVIFAGTERSARLLGVTITGGKAGDSGGGIQGNGTGSAIEKCIIRNNTASGSGGGIHAVRGRIADCRIIENTAESGGGIADCNDIVNCIVAANQATEGGGLYAVSGSIIHCTVADNGADKGAGFSQCTGLIENSIIWGNQFDPLYQSSVPTDSCIQGDPRGEGNIDTDPEFIDPASGDYRLAFGSFCIDAADPNTAIPVKADINGHVRPFDGNNDGTILPDMGAYEMPLSDQVVIGISQNELVFTDLDPDPQTFKLWNAGVPAVHYSIADPDCQWLSVSPTAGTAFGAAETITLTVNTTEVPAGSYTCQLAISDPAAVNNPRTVDVRLTLFQDEINLTPTGPTLQHALSYVNEGGTLLLADGVYSGPGNRNIDLKGKAVTIKSINGPDNCTLDLNADPNSPARGFLFRNGEDADTVLEGLTIINAYTPQSGGAVLCEQSSPTVTGCVFRNNRSAEDGGAVYAEQGSPIFRQCVFQENEADWGGGIAVFGGDLSLVDCAFLSNRALRGGAVHVNTGSITMTDSLLTQNTAFDGGAIFNDQATGELTGCIFTENTATLQDWDHGGGALFNLDSNLIIQDGRFISNTGGWDGGAIENWRSSPLIDRCEFTDNRALGNDGGALFNTFGSDPVITQCTFTDNRAKSWGGAMRNRQSSPSIENCLFAGNDAVDNGGGIFNFFESSPSIVHCTFAQNTAHGHEGGAMYSLRDCNPQVTNSIFWANELPQVFDADAETAIAYSTIDWPGAGNNTLPPQFVDPNNGDFRLQRTSPCIDSGKDVPLAIDLAGDVRPWDSPWSANASSGYDRGAFEFTAVEAALKITPQAINLKSRGKSPRGRLVFPAGIRLKDIDTAQPAMLITEQFAFPVEKIDFSTKKGLLRMDIQLDRSPLAAHIESTGQIKVSITVPLTSGHTVYATDTIRIKSK